MGPCDTCPWKPDNKRNRWWMRAWAKLTGAGILVKGVHRCHEKSSDLCGKPDAGNVCVGRKRAVITFDDSNNMWHSGYVRVEVGGVTVESIFVDDYLVKREDLHGVYDIIDEMKAKYHTGRVKTISGPNWR